MLTRELGVWLVPTVVLLLWTGRPRWTRDALVAPAIALGVGALLVLPWTIRNTATFHAFVPVTTTSGVGVAGTYNQTSYDDPHDPEVWRAPWFDPDTAQVILDHQGDDEAQLDKLLRSKAIEFVRAHPASVPKAMWWNTVRLFDLQGPDHALFIRQFIPYPEGLTHVAVFASYAMWLAAIAALFVRDIRRRLPWAVALFPLLVWLNLAILSGNIRYRASIEPFGVMLAAAWLAFVLRTRDERAGAVEPGEAVAV
jgi:hypothetical protein